MIFYIYTFPTSTTYFSSYPRSKIYLFSPHPISPARIGSLSAKTTAHARSTFSPTSNHSFSRLVNYTRHRCYSILIPRRLPVRLVKIQTRLPHPSTRIYLCNCTIYVHDYPTPLYSHVPSVSFQSKTFVSLSLDQDVFRCKKPLTAPVPNLPITLYVYK